MEIASVEVESEWAGRYRANFAGDIAVVKLKDERNEIFLNDHIRPICLPFGDEDEVTFRKIQNQQVGLVAGWGLYGATKASDVLRKIEIPIVKKSECLNKFPNLASIVWEESFCSGSELARVCQGDSGSGYYVEVDGKYYLRGVVSSGLESGDDSCRTKSVSLFSDVIGYMKFIQKVSYWSLKVDFFKHIIVMKFKHF